MGSIASSAIFSFLTVKQNKNYSDYLLISVAGGIIGYYLFTALDSQQVLSNKLGLLFPALSGVAGLTLYELVLRNN